MPALQTETPRLEPGRSNQRKYCTATVMPVKFKNYQQKKESQNPQP
jgi:hypothetical protein